MKKLLWKKIAVVLAVISISFNASAITVSDLSINVIGARKQITGTVAFDSSYPTGGESLTPAMVGLSNIESFVMPADTYGFSFGYDYTNNKVLVFGSSLVATPAIVDEVVSVSSHTGTLASLPLIIQDVYATAGTTTGVKAMIPTGITPLTGQVAVTQTTGVLTFNTSDAVTSAKVTYLKKASEVANGTSLSTLSNTKKVTFTATGY